jgi:signal transduction histidine kinase
MAGVDDAPQDAARRDEALQEQLRRQQKLESIGTLARGVAHEINNPVQSIMNYAQLIKRRGVSAEVDGYAAEILHEAQRVASIVRSLLSFARQAGEPYTDVSVREVVEGTLSLVTAMLRADGITVRVQVAPELRFARCHPQQVQQVLHNLIANARDALQEQFAATGAASREILIKAEAVSNDGGTWTRLSVRDEGIGMSPEMRERAFDPFYTTKTDRPGAGLGLSIAHGIVVEHGGVISIESELGRWTCVNVDLPAR